ncbi:coiled-coil domain-containing protein 69-like [Ptychodera flava]|uniref:coiled-coil domain-containing protein 69-like n=1 Tax=Ptychodera flava TaxID=63121 RepID=UPI003969D3AF
MKECTSSDDNVNPVMSVSARAAEIEKMEKEKTKEQIVAMKKEEDKTIQAMMVEDIDDQQKQLETDFEERSAAIQAQIETLRRTHQALVDELQHGLDNMRVEKKVKQEELTRKQDELMRQSYMP